MEQQYIDVFFNAMGNKTLWAFTSEIRYFAMLGFNNANLLLATYCAIAGAFIGSAINYGVGRLMSRLQFNGVSVIPQERYDAWQKRLTYAAPLIGIFSWIHLVGVLVVVCGFLRVKARWMLPALAVGQVIYYAYVYSQHVA